MNHDVKVKPTNRTNGIVIMTVLLSLLCTVYSIAAVSISTPQIDAKGDKVLITIPISAGEFEVGKPGLSKNIVFFDIKDATVSKSRLSAALKNSPVLKVSVSQFNSNPAVARAVIYFSPKVTGKDAIKSVEISKESNAILVVIDPFVATGKKAAVISEKVIIPPPPPVPPIERLVSVTFSQADIADVIRALADKSGLNIYAGPDIQGKVSLQVSNQPVGQVLKNILEVNGYLLEKISDSAVKVTRKPEEKPVVALPPPPPPGPVTKVFAIDYANVAEIQNAVTKLISVDVIQNMVPSIPPKIVAGAGTLIITAPADVMQDVEMLIKKLDKPIQQVMIDIRLVNVQIANDKDIGFGWDAMFSGNVGGASAGGFAYSPIAGSVLSAASSLIGLGTNAQSGNIVFNLSNHQYDILGSLRMMVTIDKADILANPKLVAMNNTQSTFDLTEEIPYVEWTYDQQNAILTGTVKFDKKAGIQVTVTPQITSDGRIMLHIIPNQTIHKGDIEVQTSAGGGVSAIPIIDTRKVDVTVMMKNGQTLVIGGLRNKQELITEKKLPWLSDIPMLGELFKQKVTNKTKSDLIMLVTPTIIPDDMGLTPEEKMMYDRVDFF